jgi:ketosteroid isomerase-like protein
MLIDPHARSRLLSDTPMPEGQRVALNAWYPIYGARTNPLKPTCRRIAPRLKLRPMIAALLVLGTCAAPAAFSLGLPRVQKHETRREIDQLEDSWRDAILKSNTTVMNNLLADDYMAITASGTLQTKEQTLASLRAGRMHFTSLEISDRKVRFYGTTALVTSVADVKGTTSEGDVSGSYRYTRVYVRDPQGVWKVVSFEVSRIREPVEHNEHK